MTDTPLAVITRPEPEGPAVRQRPLFLVVVLGLVLGFRLLLHVWAPDRQTDFDLLYNAAAQLLRGENPYQMAAQWFPYPLPAVLLAVPFTAIPLELARPIFDVLVGWAFGYALWRYRGAFALLALLSGAYLFALWQGQTTPLMVAASLIPALGFLLAVRPNTSAALWLARPRPIAVLGAGAFLFLSLLVLPSWPEDWWMALQQEPTQWMPPILRPFGLILLLAALRWRLPEGRLLLAIAFIPQSILPYELVPLALIPAGLLEMGIYAAGSWVAVAVAANWIQLGPGVAAWAEPGWLATLCAAYLPMLYLVLRRPNGTSVIAKERRRRHRLPDHDLQVEVFSSPTGGVTVKVTHLPTRLSSTETGQTRELAERKAHDKLAGILARTSRLAREA